MTARRKRPFRAPRGVIEEAPDGSWRVQVDSIAYLDKKLTRPVLEALLTATLWADRLVALYHLITLSEGHPRTGAIWQRNVATAQYLAAGVLRELSTATKRLRSALRARGWYDKSDPNMIGLLRFESIWDKDRNLIAVRDRAAFHVDQAVISVGLNALAKDKRPLVLLQGDGEKQAQVYCPAALEAIFNGLFPDEATRRRTLETTFESLTVARVLKDIFDALLIRADIPLARGEWTK